MIKKPIKTRKKPSPKSKLALKKKQSIGIVLRIKETKLIGTQYENKVMDVCSRNNYPLVFKGGTVRGKRADFINRDKRLIIEVYNPARSAEELQARLRAFLIQCFKTKYITKERLSEPNWFVFCTTSIKAFIGQ